MTVTDVDASVAWYRQVLSLKQVGIARHEGGFGIVMSTPDEGVWLVLHHHDANPGETFTETRTGLDHVAFHVPSYDHLVAWRDHFDTHGVRHSEIVPIADSAMLSSKLVKNATLKIYEGAPRGLATTHKDKFNADLLAFLQS